jgi:hypothetical protein
MVSSVVPFSPIEVDLPSIASMCSLLQATSSALFHGYCISAAMLWYSNAELKCLCLALGTRQYDAFCCQTSRGTEGLHTISEATAPIRHTNSATCNTRNRNAHTDQISAQLKQKSPIRGECQRAPTRFCTKPCTKANCSSSKMVEVKAGKAYGCCLVFSRRIGLDHDSPHAGLSLSEDMENCGTT